ncbi:permease [Bacillus lacus]|uniref:Permease n=1 Tax=Metabacillus lacus TaxID=1983721 RepID=A0A7X2LYF9_9BACI|nr:permease [Metabacillus lacus]
MWEEVIYKFLGIALELALLFMVISFFIHLLQMLLPYERIQALLKESSLVKSGCLAFIFAFVTPFCSCSTIPIIVNLLNNRVRFGIVMVFLFSSPILNPVILTLMTALLGWKVALFYTVITSLLSLLIGFTLEALGFEREVKKVLINHDNEKTKGVNVKGAFLETIKMMKHVFPFILIGAAIGGILHGAVPTDFITQHFGGERWWLVPIAAVAGIPLYIRLSSMIPITHVMVAKGMVLGPVMALMISSAGASLPELALLSSIFKVKLMMVFVISVISMATISGFLFYII